MEMSFMTIKEKEYINYVSTKNLKHFSDDINYSLVLKGTKQDYNTTLSENKCTYTFGKEKYGENKKRRYYAHASKLPLHVMLYYEVDDLITKVTYNKYFSNIIPVNFDLKKYLGSKNVWLLLNLIFEDEKCIKEHVRTLLDNFEDIENINEFSEFVNLCYDKIPKFSVDEINNSFLDNFVKNEAGIVLATALIINNSDFYALLYKSFMSRPNIALESDRIWNLLVVLFKLSNHEQKFALVKLSKNKLLAIRHKQDKLLAANNFIKCIGLEPKDIFS